MTDLYQLVRQANEPGIGVSMGLLGNGLPFSKVVIRASSLFDIFNVCMGQLKLTTILGLFGTTGKELAENMGWGWRVVTG